MLIDRLLYSVPFTSKGFWHEFELQKILSLDIDGDGLAQPHIDGLLILRFLFGFKGLSLTENIEFDNHNCVNCDYESLVDILRVHEVKGVFDIDKNGKSDALTDGIIILRKLSNITGLSLIRTAIASDFKKCDLDEIEDHLRSNTGLDSQVPFYQEETSTTRLEGETPSSRDLRRPQGRRLERPRAVQRALRAENAVRVS